jgi:hypothetical protein
MEDIFEWVTTNYLSALGVLITLCSAVFGFYQSKIKERLERALIGDNWELFHRASQANGHTQLALKEYLKVHKDNLDAGIVSVLSMGDGFGQNVFKTTVRLIHKSEPEYNSATIEKWIKSGRVNPEYKSLFEIYLETEDL